MLETTSGKVDVQRRAVASSFSRASFQMGPVAVARASVSRRGRNARCRGGNIAVDRLTAAEKPMVKRANDAEANGMMKSLIRDPYLE